MFAQANWFQLTPMRRRQRLYLRPVSWQGRAYTAAWGAAVAAPCLALFSWGQMPEALLWLAASLGMLMWDLRPVRQQLRRQGANSGQPTVADADVQLVHDEKDRLARRHSHHFRGRC